MKTIKDLNALIARVEEMAVNSLEGLDWNPEYEIGNGGFSIEEDWGIEVSYTIGRCKTEVVLSASYEDPETEEEYIFSEAETAKMRKAIERILNDEFDIEDYKEEAIFGYYF